jgi:hypothetical protein
MFTSLRTAQKTGSKVKHSLPESGGYTTLCGLDTESKTGRTWWRGEGIYDTETDVTCRNCIRVMTANPEIIITVMVSEESGYAADHTDCDHASDGKSECAPHEDNCPVLNEGDECICDAECDAVGGRSLDGGVRYISETTEVLEFECDYWAIFAKDATGLTAITAESYVKFILNRPTGSHFWSLGWHLDGTGSTYSRQSYLNACKTSADDYMIDSETHFEHTLRITGAGVTPALREALFKALQSR